MTRRRRGVVLLGLALLLGGLAASEVARRETAVERRLSPVVPVVVARADVEPGRRLRARDLGVRRVPLRYAPADAATATAELIGARLDAPLSAGAYVTAAYLAGEALGVPVRRGERAAEIVATGSADLVVPGARVDVLVTRENAAELALQDVEVLAARRSGPAAEQRVAATLRVTLRQAVYLTAAQSFAREIRLLPRSPGDRGRAGAMRVGAGLR